MACCRRMIAIILDSPRPPPHQNVAAAAHRESYVRNPAVRATYGSVTPLLTSRIWSGCNRRRARRSGALRQQLLSAVQPLRREEAPLLGGGARNECALVARPNICATPPHPLKPRPYLCPLSCLICSAFIFVLFFFDAKKGGGGAKLKVEAGGGGVCVGMDGEGERWRKSGREEEDERLPIHLPILPPPSGPPTPPYNFSLGASYKPTIYLHYAPEIAICRFAGKK